MPLNYFFIFLFSWTLCFSSKAEPESNKDSFKKHQLAIEQQLIEKNISQAFWLNTKRSLLFSELDQWRKIQSYPRLLYMFIEELKKGSVIVDHFYSFFSEKLKQKDQKEMTEEKHFGIQKQIENFFRVLKSKDLQEIQSFMEEQKFSKTEKILTVLDIIYKGSLDEKIFDLMNSIHVSVNDSLAFNELSPIFVPKELKNTTKKAIVLSHHLINSKNPKIIKKLLEQDIDFNLKPLTEDNLIHSYIILNQNFSTKKEKKLFFKGLYSLLEAPQAKALLITENGLGIKPISFAFTHPDKKIRKIFKAELRKFQLSPEQINSPNYTSLWYYLYNNSEPETKKAFKTSYISFQSFFENLISYFDPFQQTPKQRETFVSFFSFFQQELMLVEEKRLTLIYNLISDLIPDKNEEFKDIKLFFKAMIEKDSTVFKTLNIQTKEEAKKLFTNFFYQSEQGVFLLSNLLLESIRHSFVPGVGYLLNLSEKFPEVKEILIENKNIRSLTLDPLSLAFVSYGSLNEKDPLKISAKQIIQLLYKHLPDFRAYRFPLALEPLEWALFFGLLEEAQFLIESKKASFSPKTFLDIDSELFVIKWDYYSKEQGFKNLTKYINSLIEPAEPDNSIQGTLEKVADTATKKSQEALSQISPEEWIEKALGHKAFKKYKKGSLKLKDLESLNKAEDKQNLKSTGSALDPMDLFAKRTVDKFKESLENKEPCKKIFH